MKILVLGGTRFIGLHAVQRLVTLGHEVCCFHRGKSTATLPEGISEILGERADLETFQKQFLEWEPERILDTMALTETDGEVARKLFAGHVQRYVVLSSADVYLAYDRLRLADPGEQIPTPLTEQSPLRKFKYPYRNETMKPEDRLYNYDKILMEQAIMSDPNGLPVTSLRLPMVYGPYDYQNRTAHYIKRFKDGRNYILLSASLANWHGLRGYVEDMACAITNSVLDSRSTSHIYNVSDQPCLTEKQWLEQVAAAYGWTGNILVVPDAKMPDSLKEPYDWQQDWSMDASSIRNDLGDFKTTTLDNAISTTVNWQKENMPETLNPADFKYEEEDRFIQTYLS